MSAEPAAAAPPSSGTEATAAAPVTSPAAPDAVLPFMVTATGRIDAREYKEAVDILQTGIRDIEREGTRYDPRLVAPLTLLGDAFYGAGDYPSARVAYESAIHVARVNDGLHTPAQVPVVYKEAATYEAAGDFQHANDRYEYAYDVLARRYGPTSTEIVPAMYQLAQWYVRAHNIFAARSVYDQALDILSRAHGDQSPERVPALRGLADTYRFERFPPYIVSARSEPAFNMVSGGGETMAPMTADPGLTVNHFSEGERALQQVIDILDHDAGTPRLDVALAVVDLADWYLLFEKWERARTLYAHAEKLMREEAKRSDAEIASYFGHPTPLWLQLPPDPAPPPADLRRQAATGYIELSYTVSVQGEVRDLVTLASVPEGLMDLAVRKQFRAARFRPQFANGEMIEAKDQRFRHEYFYYPRSQDAKDAQGEGDTGKEAGKTGNGAAVPPAAAPAPDPAAAGDVSTPPTPAR